MTRCPRLSTAVFPAPAGVILERLILDAEALGFPRTCGGDPREEQDGHIKAWFSPHLRG